MTTRAVVYTGTRNLYEAMIPALKSLLINADVDRVFLLIEDDVFPYPLPKIVTTINVSGQQFFRPIGPNFRTHWTWMTLMRCALARILPEDLDRVLYLDVDTLVLGLADLWDIDLGDCLVAGVPEPQKSQDRLYVNAGVLLFNLKQIRLEHADGALIAALDTKPFAYPDQDALNLVWQDRILAISSCWNENDFTARCRSPRILHYAAIRNWTELPIVDWYRKAPWPKQGD